MTSSKFSSKSASLLLLSTDTLLLLSPPHTKKVYSYVAVLSQNAELLFCWLDWLLVIKQRVCHVIYPVQGRILLVAFLKIIASPTYMLILCTNRDYTTCMKLSDCSKNYSTIVALIIQILKQVCVCWDNVYIFQRNDVTKKRRRWRIIAAYSGAVTQFRSRTAYIFTSYYIICTTWSRGIRIRIHNIREMVPSSIY